MLDEKDTKRAARLFAIESLLTTAMAMLIKAQRLSHTEIDEVVEGLIEQRRRATIPDVNAAVSDLLSSEIEEAFRRLLDRVAQKAKEPLS